MKKIVLGLILFTVLSFNANGQELDLKYEKYKKNALTFGLLNGGGLIGAELETLLKGRLGAHLGFGFVGACVGLDFHMKPTTTSSAFVLELRAQGVGEIYTGTMVGLGYLIRYKGISLQLGGSYLLDEGPNTIENWNTRPFVPQVSLGFFNAF
jgi:hypothetical protein